MEQRKAEIERLFAELEEAHKVSIKLHRLIMVVGPLAVILCGAMGVWKAWEGKPFWAFIEFFLCLFNANLLAKNIKEHKESEKDWAEFETRHRILMEHWEELTEHET